MKKYRFFSVVLALAAMFTLFSVPAAALEDPDIQAEHVILVDGTYGEVLYEKRAQERAYPASITKVMTALLVLEAIDAGKLTEDTLITASEVDR